MPKADNDDVIFVTHRDIPVRYVMTWRIRTIAPCAWQYRTMGETEDHATATLYIGMLDAYNHVVNTQYRGIIDAPFNRRALNLSGVLCYVGKACDLGVRAVNRVWRTCLSFNALLGEVNNGRTCYGVAALSAAKMEYSSISPRAISKDTSKGHFRSIVSHPYRLGDWTSPRRFNRVKVLAKDLFTIGE